MAFLSNLFKPKEVKDLLFTLEQLDGHFAEILGWPDVKRTVAGMIVDNATRVRKAVIVEQRAHVQIVLTLIANRCFADIETGSEHVYRGVLGMSGNWKRSIFHIAQAQLVERGFLTKDEADEAEVNLRQRIAEAG